MFGCPGSRGNQATSLKKVLGLLCDLCESFAIFAAKSFLIASLRSLCKVHEDGVCYICRSSEPLSDRPQYTSQPALAEVPAAETHPAEPRHENPAHRISRPIAVPLSCAVPLS